MNRWFRKTVMAVLLLVVFEGLYAQEQGPRPQAPALDEAVVKLCRRLIELHEERISSEKERSAKVLEGIEKALPLFKLGMEEAYKKYRDTAPEELKTLISNYASEYRRISLATGIDEGDRRQLQDYLTDSMAKAIKAADPKGILDYSGAFSSPGNLGTEFDNRGSSRVECKVENGKSLICLQCSNFYLKNSPSAQCQVKFSVDLNTGILAGLESVEDQRDHLQTMENAHNRSQGYSYSNNSIPDLATNFNSDLIKLERGDGLPRVCKRLWRQDKEAAINTGSSKAGAKTDNHSEK